MITEVLIYTMLAPYSRGRSARKVPFMSNKSTKQLVADDLFKKQIVRYTGPDGKRCPPGTPGAAKIVEESRKWYATVGRKAVPLHGDKAIARRMLTQLKAKAALARSGKAPISTT